MNREDLIKNINAVKSCISDNPVVAILSFISFQDNLITTFNGEQGAIIYTDNSGLNFSIKGKLFLKMLQSLSEKDIDIVRNNDNCIEMLCGKFKNKMLIESHNKFPFPYEMEKNMKILCDINSNFIDGVKKCLVSTDKTSIKKEYAGISVIAKKGEFITLYSSKYNHIITKYVTNIISSEDVSAILPYQFCSLMINQFDDEQTNSLFIGDRIVSLTTNNRIVYTMYDKELTTLDFEKEITSLGIDDIQTVTYLVIM